MSWNFLLERQEGFAHWTNHSPYNLPSSTELQFPEINASNHYIMEFLEVHVGLPVLFLAFWL